MQFISNSRARLNEPYFMIFEMCNLLSTETDNSFLLPRLPSGPKCDCYARGLWFDNQVEQKVLLGFSMKSSVAVRS